MFALFVGMWAEVFLFDWFRSDTFAVRRTTRKPNIAVMEQHQPQCVGVEHVQIEESWKCLLAEEFTRPYFYKLKQLLLEAKRKTRVFPPGPLLFRAFALTPFSQLKIVLLGQDPYHGYNQAMGLSFSVPQGVPVPPSLKNIYREIADDLAQPAIANRTSGDLTHWARQGVLLLNAVLSVGEGLPNSHVHFGWQHFTDAVISSINQQAEGIVFLLWGRKAQEKMSLIDTQKHLVLTAAHPSPLSSGRFFGCRHFSQANEFLRKTGREPIRW